MGTGQLVYSRLLMALNEEDKQWIRAELERVETKLLTPFHMWASPVDLRQRSHSAAIRALPVSPAHNGHQSPCALDQEMEDLQDRVTKLEQPPTA
jgi:hypothetical protein